MEVSNCDEFHWNITMYCGDKWQNAPPQSAYLTISGPPWPWPMTFWPQNLISSLLSTNAPKCKFAEIPIVLCNLSCKQTFSTWSLTEVWTQAKDRIPPVQRLLASDEHVSLSLFIIHFTSFTPCLQCTIATNFSQHILMTYIIFVLTGFLPYFLFGPVQQPKVAAHQFVSVYYAFQLTS